MYLFFNDTATTEIYTYGHTLSLHDALPICGVEIGDLKVRIGPDRVRERSRILGELRRAERPHVLDPLDRGRPLIGRKALVAIDGEALLQRKLEPVAAGDAIARPIVEIFVRDDARDRVVILVGQHGRASCRERVCKDS